MPNLALFVPATVLVGGILLLASAHDQDRPEPRRPLSTIMQSVEGYTHEAQLVDTNSQRVAGMDHYVARIYRRDTVPMWTLYVGYYKYQEQGHTIHSPRNCLPGAGWEPVESTTLPIPGITDEGSRDMNKYVLANRGAYAAVYYWYQGRGRIESNEYRVKYNLLRDAARHGRTEEALVRMVVPLDLGRDRSPERVKQLVKQADSLALALAPRLAGDVRAVMPLAPAE
ncbi:MAG: EpsI family protein [Gemmatimonadaceae bacterium]|jgi:EpsI family protein|nr:EpsI family protein [Gemmatimonadaceae bacterium]